MTSSQELLADWRQRGRTVEVGGHRVFVVDADVAESVGDPLVVLHGFPTSSLDFYRVLPLLSQRRVVLHDHLGFGFSEKPENYSYSLLEQAEVALQVWADLGLQSVHLLGHDYGTSVATEILARRERGGTPVELRSVTLSNGSMLLHLARLRASQRLLRSPLGPVFQRLVRRGYFKRVMRRLWADRKRAHDLDLEAMWAAIRENDGHLRAAQISSYLGERRRFQERWIGALRRLEVPLHLLWGRLDPVAVPAVAEALKSEASRASLEWLELGHYPMLEAPGVYAKGVAAFLDQVESSGGVDPVT